MLARSGPAAPVVDLWLGEAAAEWARRAIVAAGCLLVLDSAGTLHAGYTLTLSYLLVAVACVIGAPELVRRWGTLPKAVRTFAPALLAVYIAAAVVGQPQTLANSGRAGAEREAVYLVDLALGLTTMLLVPALWSGRSAAPVARAIAIAGAIAGVYAVYQWFGLRYGLPFSDINNTLDSNGITSGASQGIGLFGGQRVRGTFLEPHFLGAFLSATLPLQAWSAWHAGGRIRTMLAVGVVASAVALLLTDSAPAWGTLILGIGSGAVLVSIGRGWVKTSAVIGVAAAALWLAVVPTVAAPSVLAPLTGRPAGELSYTSSYRTSIWKLDVRLWERRPVLGYGPGQSAVQVAYAYSAPAKPPILVSAQGVWAAALLDSGVVGLCTWIYLLGAVLITGIVGVVRRPTVLAGAAFAAALAVVLDIATSGDRLDPRHWLVLGLLLAATSRLGSTEPGQPKE